MAITFFASQISDLCLGKPPLRSLPITATVSDAISALKKSGDTYVSIWSCCDADVTISRCRCVAKICMVDVVVFLCNEKNLVNPLDALQTNVLEIVSKVQGQIKHLEPDSSLLDAIDCILGGAQNLVIPVYNHSKGNPSIKDQLTKPSLFTPTLHYIHDYCWLTQEDVVRFLLNSIGVFSSIPTFTIQALDIIDKRILTVHQDDPAVSTLPLITCSLMEQTSIGVVNKDNRLIGEISPFTLACCDETVAAAIMTLSAGDLMSYIDYTGPSDDLVQLVKMRLLEKNYNAMLDLMDEYYTNPLLTPSTSCSSEEDFWSSKNACVGRFYPGRRSEAIMCHPWNSLMAVMVQMIALRVSYAWVVQQDYTLVGIVTFSEILKQFRSMAGSR